MRKNMHNFVGASAVISTLGGYPRGKCPPRAKSRIYISKTIHPL